jgi:hypothetical protein
MRRGLACAGVLGALLACASPDAERHAAARDVVGRFFAALPSGDCAVLGPLLTAPGACPELVTDLGAQGLSLVAVLEVKADGRDPNALLVRTRVARGGAVHEQPLLLRVERRPDGWRLRF